MAVAAGFIVQLVTFSVYHVGASRAVQRSEVLRQKLGDGSLSVTGCLIVLGQALLAIGLVSLVWCVLFMAMMFACILYFISPELANQGHVTTGFVGGLLVKTFVIPAIWGAIKSKAFQAFMSWLRGGKPKPTQ